MWGRKVNKITGAAELRCVSTRLRRHPTEHRRCDVVSAPGVVKRSLGGRCRIHTYRSIVDAMLLRSPYMFRRNHIARPGLGIREIAPSPGFAALHPVLIQRRLYEARGVICYRVPCPFHRPETVRPKSMQKEAAMAAFIVIKREKKSGGDSGFAFFFIILRLNKDERGKTAEH